MEANPYYLKDTEGDYYNQYPEFQIWEDGKQAGIKLVVEWVKEHGQVRTWSDFGEFGQGIISKYCLSETAWQSKLKEWGIK